MIMETNIGNDEVSKKLIDLLSDTETWNALQGENVEAGALEAEISKVRQLLEDGANPNVTADLEPESTLCLAVSASCPELVKMLIDYGATVNAVDTDGNTAVIQTCDDNGINRYDDESWSDGYERPQSGCSSTGWP